MIRIYLDNNSTTPLLPDVARAMNDVMAQHWGNPASAHRQGAAARQAVEQARATVAQCLGAFPDEVLFTSGATEANNLALFGSADHARQPGNLLAARIEHPSISEPCKALTEQGWRLQECSVDETGYVQPPDALQHTTPETLIVTIQLANHETGVVQNLAAFRQLWPDAVFHTDATQAVGKMPVNFHQQAVSTLSCSAHKFHGPQGIGVLLVNRCVRLNPRLFGGHQQQGIRPGTEPVALAVGLATALRLATEQMHQRQTHCRLLRQAFLQELRQHFTDFVINGDSELGLPHVLNISFPGCPSETLFIRLDLAGVDCSTGSACSSGSMLPSPVLQAMNVPVPLLKSAMRFSMNHLLTAGDVTEAARRVACEVSLLRNRQKPGN